MLIYITFCIYRKKTINTLEMLIVYNNISIEILFKKSFYFCKICFTEKSRENCMQLLPCNHIFCKECTADFFESRIKEGTGYNIKCLDYDCKSEALLNLVR